MKRCPFCALALQNEAHHCHHCNSTVIDMDGNPLGPRVARRQLEWMEIALRVFVTIFFTVNFFIVGLILVRQLLAVSIIEMDSWLSIVANVILLLLSGAAAYKLSPHILKWAKENLARMTK